MIQAACCSTVGGRSPSVSTLSSPELPSVQPLVSSSLLLSLPATFARFLDALAAFVAQPVESSLALPECILH